MTRILSIDDSKAVHAFIRQCLNGKQVELFDMFDGKQALEEVLGQKKKFDLILLDWEMPEIDGLGTLKAFRSAKLETPVIMLTSKNKVEDISAMLDAGAQEYVMKPFTEEILVNKIETILGFGIR